ncbi:MAG: acyl-CoA desaturase [Planctomycetes bacterium]|nr:acyl-CoA desaturase [Planctomycetota bacterium]
MQTSPAAPPQSKFLPLAVRRWIDSWEGIDDPLPPRDKRVDWLRIMPFVLLHVACIAVVWVGWSWFAVGAALVLYVVRMFGITAFYHRYFSHRTFKTSRAMQFAFAVLGNSSVQRGPLWWAAHHREHHLNSDTPEDTHSPVRDGFWWSHVGWITAKFNFATRRERVKDLLKYPELVFLDRYDTLVPILFFAALYGLGAALERFAPGLGTNGWQLLVWGLISTVALFHGTFTINSLTHMYGTRRFQTPDHSRNNWLLAIITLGEGWHNNHHHYQGSVRQGFVWWEYDFSYYALVAMSWLGLVWDLNQVPPVIMTKRLEQAR